MREQFRCDLEALKERGIRNNVAVPDYAVLGSRRIEL